jgi:hypothetical protein
MSRLTLPEHRERFRWLHEPPHWQLDDSLTFTTAPDTDYWQRTHYGFRRDNGHFFSIPVRGDFVLSARYASAPNAQYDQCGLLVRADSDTWVRCSTVAWSGRDRGRRCGRHGRGSPPSSSQRFHSRRAPYEAAEGRR